MGSLFRYTRGGEKSKINSEGISMSDLEKSGICGTLRKIGLSETIEDHFQFFIHILWDNCIISYHIMSLETCDKNTVATAKLVMCSQISF